MENEKKVMYGYRIWNTMDESN